jgi:hypothetical protein
MWFLTDIDYAVFESEFRGIGVRVRKRKAWRYSRIRIRWLDPAGQAAVGAEVRRRYQAEVRAELRLHWQASLVLAVLV